MSAGQLPFHSYHVTNHLDLLFKANYMEHKLCFLDIFVDLWMNVFHVFHSTQEPSGSTVLLLSLCLSFLL